MHTHDILSVKKIFREAYGIMKPKLWRVIGQFAIVLVIFAAIDVLSKNNLLLSVVSSTLFAFVTTIISLAYAEHGRFSFHEAWKSLTWKRLGYFAAAYLLAKIIIIIGCMLLIVPGVIATLALFPMKYLAMKEDIQPIPALKKSLKLTKGHRMKIFEIAFFAVLINIAGALCLVVGLFFTVPLTLIAFALIYKKLAGDTVHAEEPKVVEPAEPEAAVVDAEVVPA